MKTLVFNLLLPLGAATTHPALVIASTVQFTIAAPDGYSRTFPSPAGLPCISTRTAEIACGTDPGADLMLGILTQPANDAVFSTNAFTSFVATGSLFNRTAGASYNIKLSTNTNIGSGGNATNPYAGESKYRHTALLGTITFSSPTLTGVGYSTDNAATGAGVLVHNSSGTMRFKLFGNGLTPGVSVYIQDTFNPNMTGNAMGV